MKNRHRWRPTRFVRGRNGWRGSSDARDVAPASRHIADLQARSYAPALQTYARGRLLDLGCGEVPLYEMYKDAVTAAVCVDWPRSYHDRTHLDVACDINQPLPFADNSFETVVLSDVLEHLHDHQTVWSEIARVLRPSGHVIIGVPFLYWLHEEPYDYFRPTEFALRRFCEQNGLRVVLLAPFGGAIDVIFDIAAKHLGVVPVLARGFYWVGRALLPFGRRLLARTNRKFPLGYVLVAAR